MEAILIKSRYEENGDFPTNEYQFKINNIEYKVKIVEDQFGVDHFFWKDDSWHNLGWSEEVQQFFDYLEDNPGCMDDVEEGEKFIID